MLNGNKYIFFGFMYKMLNLSLEELRLIAKKKRNIIDNKSIPKGKLLRIINNKKTDRKCFINPKEQPKQFFISNEK